MSKSHLVNVLGGAVRHGILQGSGFLLSLLVVRGHSEALWGGFALLQLQVGLCALVANWGHRDFLLRRFAERPGGENRLWWNNLASRAWILGVAAAVPASLNRNDPWLAALLCLWLAALFASQSIEVWIVRFQGFAWAAWAEGAGLLATILALAATFPGWDLRVLAFCWTIGALGRLAILLAIFGPALRPVGEGRWDPSQLAEGWPFFLLALSGMLMSRLDVLSVGAALDDAATGRYQVMMGHFIALQVPAAFLTAPFVRHLYRLPRKSLYRFAARLAASGLAVLSVAGPLCWASLRWGYGFGDLPWTLSMAGPLFAFPTYLYVPLMYGLYRQKKEKKVLAVGLLVAVAGALLSYGLALTTMGMMGGWLAQTILQWTVLFFYLLI
jgi:O-antigen/teichoic acid export membrane protein